MLETQEEVCRCYWCKTVFTNEQINWDENAEPHCPECGLTGVMKA